jgi:hypothetical protein
MATQYLGSLRPVNSDADIVALDLRKLETARRSVEDKIPDVPTLLAQADRDQLARDMADIESATAALRKAEPTLESWTKSTTATVRGPRPLWLLIGALWLSSALVAAAAVVAIAAFAG